MGLLNHFRDESGLFPDCSGVLHQEQGETDNRDRLLYVYYLNPRSGGFNDVKRLFSEDRELFELAMIHHEEIWKHRPNTFAELYNTSGIPDGGLILFK